MLRGFRCPDLGMGSGWGRLKQGFGSSLWLVLLVSISAYDGENFSEGA